MRPRLKVRGPFEGASSTRPLGLPPGRWSAKQPTGTQARQAGRRAVVTIAKVAMTWASDSPALARPPDDRRRGSESDQIPRELHETALAHRPYMLDGRSEDRRPRHDPRVLGELGSARSSHRQGARVERWAPGPRWLTSRTIAMSSRAADHRKKTLSEAARDVARANSPRNTWPADWLRMVPGTPETRRPSHRAQLARSRRATEA